jgi:hypothetical protein
VCLYYEYLLSILNSWYSLDFFFLCGKPQLMYSISEGVSERIMRRCLFMGFYLVGMEYEAGSAGSVRSCWRLRVCREVSLSCTW